MNYREEYKRWISYDSLDAELREELEAIKDNDEQIKERFIKPLEFGTAGLRGIIGAGINRMNRYVVAQATQGLAEVITAQGDNACARGVVIACDSRRMSDEFALEAARVFSGNGIKVRIFDSLRPVPELSFAIRYLNAIAGVVITASHNPRQYNGYKAYWEDAFQLPPEFADKVTEVINRTDLFAGVRRDETMKNVETIGQNVDDAFLDEIMKLRIYPNAVKQAGDFSIVYTPLHGAGNIPVREALKRAGHEHVIVVAEQEKPDPMFPTVKTPNPEDRACFTIAMEYAKKSGSELIIATDPDCDRVGAAVLDDNGEYILLTGNQIGVLLTHYIAKGLKEQGRLPQNGAVIKSVVSTKMAEAVCEDMGIALIPVLTGFKYIGEKIKEFEEAQKYTFLFGFEESYGFLSGTHARDKDGVNASVLIAEMAAYYKIKGMTLNEALCALYEEYGYYMERVISLTFEGLLGLEKIKALMEDLRKNPPSHLKGTAVARVSDYLYPDKAGDGLPSADMLRFDLEDDTSLFIRPSGTEPKIKGYIMVKAGDREKAESKLEYYEAAFRDIAI